MFYSPIRFGWTGIVLLGLFVGTCLADEPPLLNAKTEPGPQAAQPSINSLADLKRLSPEELELLFGSLQPGDQPVGYTRGEVLYLKNMSLPRLKKKLSGTVWKGKHFREDGNFTNQFAGFRAIDSRVVIGPSYFDGKPSMVMEYPDKTPFFANMRDELREVAQGVYLAMIFERTAPNRFQGFIGLELEKPKGRWPR